MTPSLLASTSFPGPGSGLFVGASRPGADLGWGRPAGSLPGVASARLVGGLARGVPLRGPGVSRCGAASQVGGGRDGGEPFYVEGCGCGGACASGRRGTAHRSARIVQDPVVEQGRELAANVPESEPCYSEGFQERFDQVDCSPIAQRVLTLDDCTMMGVPSAAWSQPCASPREGEPDWNHWNDCGPPFWHKTLDDHACTTESEDIDDLMRWVGLGGCGGTMTALLRKAWCMLHENRDIVRWVTCLVYGNGNYCIDEVFAGERDAEMGCWSSETAAFWGVASYAFGSPLGGVTLVPSHAAWQGLMSMYDDGVGDERLCAVAMAATILYHEMNHVCMYGGVYNNDPQDANFQGDDRCEPTWISSATLQAALLMRYPRARLDPCCSTVCLSQLFWSEQVATWVPGSRCT